MTTTIIVLLIILIASIGFLIYLFFKNISNEKSDEKLIIFNEKLSELRRQNEVLR